MNEDDAACRSGAPDPAVNSPARPFNTLEISFLDAGVEMDRAAAALPPALGADDPTETVSLTHRIFRSARDRIRRPHRGLVPVAAAAVAAGLAVVGLLALHTRPVPAALVVTAPASPPAVTAAPKPVAAIAAAPTPRAKAAAKSRPRSNTGASPSRKARAPKDQRGWFSQLSKR